MRKIVGAAGLAALALALSACASSGSSSSAASAPATSAAAAGASSSAPASSSSGSTVNMTTINGTAVLTNSAGKTLYWFAPDTSTTSKCTGSCATYWPPVTGPVTAGSGVTGTLGTITRSGRHDAGHLRRASAVHLRRRHGGRAGQGQRAQPLGRPVVRDDGLRRQAGHRHHQHQHQRRGLRLLS